MWSVGTSDSAATMHQKTACEAPGSRGDTGPQTVLQSQGVNLPVRRGELPSTFLVFGLQPLRRRKLTFSKRQLLTAKNSGVSPLWVVCSHKLSFEAEINPLDHTD